jgi:hypothetical protein
MTAILVIGYVILALALLLRFTDDTRVRYTLALLFAVLACVLFLGGWKFCGSAYLAIALTLTFGPGLAHGRLPWNKK